MSCPNSAYKQEYGCEVVVREVKFILDTLIKGRPVQEWHIEIGGLEVKINTMEGEVQIWKVIFWRRSSFGLAFPLKECKQRKRYTKSSTHRFDVPKLCSFSLHCWLHLAFKFALTARVVVSQFHRRLYEHSPTRLPEEP